MFINQLSMRFSLELFLWMLGAFLIGYLFAMLFYQKTKSSTNTSTSNFEIDTKTPEEKTIDNPEELVIRAKKTVERGGIEVKETKRLDFASIGTANAEDKDDLTKINGIGSFIEEKLNSIGIYTYNQISNINNTDIETITDLIQFFPGRIQRDNWKGQAQKLLDEKTEAS